MLRSYDKEREKYIGLEVEHGEMKDKLQEIEYNYKGKSDQI